MKPRGVLIAGNWKMNYGPKEAVDFITELKTQWTSEIKPATSNFFQTRQIRACLFVPAVSLVPAIQALDLLPVSIGAQNAHWEKVGAFTGELSGPMLKEIGVDTVLIGHSERRLYFGETDESARLRAESLLEQGLQVVLCIGETRAEREAGNTQTVLTRQLDAILPEPDCLLASYLDGRLVIAYEPIWAIGTGLTATPDQAEEAHQIIRKYLWDHFGMEASGRTPLLYGGSVTAENILSLLRCANVDGALVGGSSLKPGTFLSLLQAAGSVSG